MTAAIPRVTDDDHGWRERLAVALATCATILAIVVVSDANSAATPDHRPATATSATEVSTGVERLTETPTAPPPLPGPSRSASALVEPVVVPIVVPDPRPGDLRSDERADLLPEDYSAPPAASVVLDVEYGSLPAQRLDLHLPADTDAPVLVYIHSGGWVGGDKRDVPEMILRFVDRGFAVVSVNHRLAPDHSFPAPIDDIVLALDWLRSYDEREGRIDTDHLVLAGISAGGHLAALTAATVDGTDTPIDAVVAISGPTDLTTFYVHDHAWAVPLTEALMACSPCSDGDLVDAGPASHLDGDLPHAYWAYGADDPLVDVDLQGIAMAEAWAAAAEPGASWLDVVEGHGHVLESGAINQRFLEAFVDRAIGR